MYSSQSVPLGTCWEMDDVIAERIVGNRLRTGGRLEELNVVPLGIFDLKPGAAVAAFLDLRGDLDVVRGEVLPQRFGIGGVESDMVHAIDGGSLGRRQGQDLDKLGGTEVVAYAGGVLWIGPFDGAEIVYVEVLGLAAIGGVYAQVGDTGDQRPIGWPLGIG
jgi:hypothetical protein